MIRARFGRPALISMHEGRLDVFWRSRSNSLIHTWFTGENLDTQEHVEELRSDVALLSDPIAVSRAPGKIDVFARGVNQQLLHWWCDPRQEGMQGPRQLWWCIVFDPVAVADPVFDRVDLFARRTDFALRTIGMTGDDQMAPPNLTTSDDVWPIDDHVFGPAIVITSQPAVIRLPRSIAAIYRNGDGGIAWLTWDPTAHAGGLDLHPDEPISGAIDANASPYAASFEPGRMDVYANERGWLRHWGNGFLTNGWKGPEASIGDRLDNVPTVISSHRDSTDILARGDDRTLKNWHWRGPTLRWARVQLDDDVYSDPGAISLSRERDHVKVAAVDARENLLLWTRQGEWPASPIPIVASLTPKRTIALSDDDQFTLFESMPKVLIARPEDHALVGVGWFDCEAVDGTPPHVQAGTGSPTLLITLPPQHVGEETHSEDGARSSRSFLSDSSRLALALPPGGRIPLTSKGVLEAIHGMNIVERGLLIEMPWGLSLRPKAGATGVVAQTSPETPERSAWKVALRPRDTADSLGLVATNERDSDDPFPLPLAKPDRNSVAQSTLRSPATVERLELSTLGGSLIAHGQWDNFEWDHRCLLGRDQAVRVLSKGVLYPLGHEAVFVELTERRLDPTASDPVAALRTRNMLIVTQPVRATASDAEVSRAFPFSETEILTRRVEDLTDRWVEHPLVFREIAELQDIAAELTARLPELEIQIPRNRVPEDEVHHHPAAREYVDTLSTIEQIRNAISDLGQRDRADQVPLYFWPRVNKGDLVQFDVRLQGSHGPVHVRMPLLFVMTWQLPRDHVHEAFDSLSDPAVARTLREEYGNQGVVETRGAIVNLIQSSTAPTDAFEVEALHISGFSRAGGLHPRLGLERDLAFIDSPERLWAAAVALPAARALLGKADDTARRLAYSREYEGNPAADVALNLLDGLDLDFTKDTGRSGGLMAPRMPTNAISRSIGLTNAGRFGVSTNPAEFLSEGASLLGFDLRKVIGPGTSPPKILSEIAAGQLPAVSMTWDRIPLQPADAGPLRFDPRGATITLTVSTSPARQEVTATLGPSILHFPGSSPFISLSFSSISFRQVDGRPPKIDFADPKPVFGNELRLFAKLLEAVNLGNTGPKVEITAEGATVSYQVPVPDVTLISFNLTQLEFHSRLTLPFKGGAPTALIGFGTRHRPFALGVLMFAGAGHIEIGIGANGRTTFDVSLQFGALVAMNFVIGKAEVHAFGGIACQSQGGGAPAFSAFIHLGGSIKLLGAISVAFELSIELKFVPDENRLAGRAIVALHVGLFGYSQTFELDSGEWTICGDDPTPHLAPGADDAALEAWSTYRSAFA